MSRWRLRFRGPPPDKPGVYAFLARLPPIERLSNSSDIDETTHRNAIAIISRLCNAALGRSFSGTLEESGKFTPPGVRLQIDGSIDSVDDRLRSVVALDQLRQTYNLTREFVDLLPMSPLYIGVTIDQTLRQRIDRHRQTFMSNEPTNTFGIRARGKGLVWEDVTPIWIAAREKADLDALPRVESILHLLFTPNLSER